MPPSLFVANDDSLGEQIPKRLANGDHSAFISGDDADAKAVVMDILRSFGWRDVIDLGDISTARGTEMFLPLWARTWTALGNPMFSIKVVR